MQNLVVTELDEAQFSQQGTLPLTAATFDTTTDDAICVFGPTVEKPVIELKRRPKGLHDANFATTITTWDAPSQLAELPCDSVLSLQHFAEDATICLVLAGGDLILVRERPTVDQERIEIVGSIDVGISAAAWSWNASILALITRAGSLVLMSRQLEPIREVVLQDDDLQLSKHVSVGWGKKETQFHGKRAKAMKDPTMPEFVDEGKPSPKDDGKTTISWRGDGAYLAVNSLVASNRRVIRVYTSDGVLDSVSEPVDGLESAVSWRPHGNLIAGVKRSLDGPAKLEVVFFERNGLRHGEFDLRLQEDEINGFASEVSLLWNLDSTVLAVQFRDRVQLWTSSNYHYYLKQEYRTKTPAQVTWSSSNALKLQLATESTLRSLQLNLEVSAGSVLSPFDFGLVMVIDGKRVKVTPLKHGNIPPPMAFCEIEAEENVIACAASRTCQRIAFLTHSYLYLCHFEMSTTNQKTAAIRHSTTYTLTKKKLQMFPKPTQLVIQHDDQVHLLSPACNTSSQGQAFCWEYTWVNEATETTDMRTNDVSVSRDARQILLDNDHSTIFARTSSAVSLLSPNFGSHEDIPSAAIPTALRVATRDQEHRIVSLTSGKELQIDGIPRAQQVTSIVCTDKHIVYTTSNQLLKFVHLTGTELILPDDTPEVDERCRAIEKGGVIVHIIPSTYAVVLQMPRGNLETIHPRILVLTGVRDHITRMEYRKAFLACQVHQIDLNILYDYDPQLWQENVAHFIDQLKKPGRVDEFLQKLKAEDVTQTLYRDTSKGTVINTTTKSPATDSKVNKICDALISNLQTRSSEYTPNIITAHVCKYPPDLNAALSLVSDLHKMSVDEADIAIAHLCFLTDTNRLFDAALALYDLNLTLLVAQNAQRDPREYMPFLQKLQSLPDLRRRFTIDHHLKNHAKALTSLHALSEHDELQAYTIKHSLYIQAESLYKQNPGRLNTILRLHAEDLTIKSQHSAAATIYESLSDYTSAYPLYALSHQWRESLSCASLSNLQLSEIQSLAQRLATTCIEESRDYRSAATIHIDYLNDIPTAASLLCKASYFADAIRILSLHNLSTDIDPSLTRKFGEILELIADCQTQLTSQVPRIEELRIKKAEDPLAFFGGDADVDIPDNVSLAPTDASTLGGQSMFTRYGAGGGSQASTKFAGTVASNASRRTSKTRRKEERKRARGKKGSVYEEEYLVNSVARLIERVNGTHDEVKRLVSGLRRRGLREQAEKVEEVMGEIQKGCESAKKRVWVDIAEESSYDVDGQGRPGGANGVFYDSQLEGEDTEKKAAPEVKVWKS